MRLFIAILLDQAVKDGVLSISEQLRAHSLRGNFTGRENLHLTLAFLGETPGDRLPALKTAMEAAAGEPFVLRFHQPGFFRRREGNLYWLGILENPALSALEARLRRALTEAGFPTEDKPFRPHLTLGRTVVLEEGYPLPSAAGKIPDQPVSSISLMKSERIAGRLTYTRLLETKLAP